MLVFRVSAVKIYKIYSVSPHLTTCNLLWDLLKFFDKFHFYSYQTVISDTFHAARNVLFLASRGQLFIGQTRQHSNIDEEFSLVRCGAMYIGI
jgi:hypothetical protein